MDSPEIERADAEIAKISGELINPETKEMAYCQLYAAQQAIAWMLDPQLATSPFKLIMEGKCTDPRGTPGD